MWANDGVWASGWGVGILNIGEPDAGSRGNKKTKLKLFSQIPRWSHEAISD